MNTPCTHHRHCQQTALRQARALCAARGARFTPHRQKVLEILWQSHKALTAAEIMQKMGTTQPPIIYRALDFLKDAGLVHPVNSLNAYIGCLHGDKGGHTGQLLICQTCRTVEELVPDDALQALQSAAKQRGFTVRQAAIEMLGECAACAR